MWTRNLVNLVMVVVRFVWRRPLLILGLVLLALILRHCLGAHSGPDTHPPIQRFDCPASIPQCPNPGAAGSGAP